MPAFKNMVASFGVSSQSLCSFGLALAHWLVQRGARHLLLTSKRGLRTGAQNKAIQALRKQGAQVMSVHHNI